MSRAKWKYKVRHPGLPYASIPATMLASKAFAALSPHAVAILLLFHAAYNPNSELFVAQSTARKALKASPNSISAAYKELEEGGFIVKKLDARKPGKMGGSGRARAAVYDLPIRNPNLVPRWRQQGDRKLDGYWRIHSGRIRAMVEKVSSEAVKVWCHMHAVHRNANGGPAQNVPRRLAEKELGMSRETLRRKASELVAVGLIKVAELGRGRRPALFALSGAECKGAKGRG